MFKITAKEKALILKRRKIVAGDKGRFNLFNKNELKKLDFYVDEEDGLYYVFDNVKGLMWTDGKNKNIAEKEMNSLKNKLKQLKGE